MKAATFPDRLSLASAPLGVVRLSLPRAAEATTTRIVVVEWRIKIGRESALLEHWSTRSTIRDRSGLINEFLSRIENQEQVPWAVWDLSGAWSTYVNVAVWR